MLFRINPEPKHKRRRAPGALLIDQVQRSCSQKPKLPNKTSNQQQYSAIKYSSRQSPAGQGKEQIAILPHDQDDSTLSSLSSRRDCRTRNDFFDGTWNSSHDSIEDIHDSIEALEANKPATTTLPLTPSAPLRSSNDPRSVLPLSFWSDSGAASQGDASSRDSTPVKRPLTTGRLPNRFLPTRDHEWSFSHRFRTNTESHELSSFQRLVRNESTTPDPFSSPTESTTHTRPLIRERRGHPQTGESPDFRTCYGSI
jgi:hypothetical protein